MKKGLIVLLLCFLGNTVWGQGSLRVLAHDSFTVPPALIAAFEKREKAKVTIIKGGDAGEALAKLILTKKAPIADVFYGVDNSLLPKAKAAGVFDTQSDGDEAMLYTAALPTIAPVDYGYVSLNYHRAAFNQRPLPESLEALATPEFASLLVVESPLTSSTGLLFFHATLAYFGEEKAFAWWRSLRQHGTKVTAGWSEAYYQHFAQNGGRYPIVVSYASSPAAEAFYGKLASPPTANLFLPGSYALQVEGAAVVANSPVRDLARRFIRFLQSPEVQTSIPTSMWMLPVNPKATVDPALTATLKETAGLKPHLENFSAEQQARWLKRWVEVMER